MLIYDRNVICLKSRGRYTYHSELERII